jgi:choline monooxygenase
VVGGEPIVVVRDDKGELRALSNVCRHRAAVIMREPSGCAERLRCRYHGWTYDLTGKLRGLPEFDGVEEFAREEQGLPQHRVATWGPLVWVHLAGSCSSPSAKPGANDVSLEEFLSPMPARLGSEPIGTLGFVERREYTLACNWKVFVDNYLDGGYHVNTVHPGLAGVLDYKEYKTEVFGMTSVQTSPLTSPKAGETATSATRIGKLAQYWWVYPNFMLNLYDGMMDTNLVLPIDAERCRVIIDFFFAGANDPAHKQRITGSIAVGHEIQMEDIGICEDVQRGLHSRSYDKGRFSVRREIAGHHFHKLLAERLAPAAAT